MTWTPDNIQQTLVGPVRPEQGSFSLVVANAQPGDPSALPCPTCGCPTVGLEAGRTPCGRCRSVGAEAMTLLEVVT